MVIFLGVQNSASVNYDSVPTISNPLLSSSQTASLLATMPGELAVALPPTAVALSPVPALPPLAVGD